MKRKLFKFTLAAAGLLCLHNAPIVANAAQNQGAIPPPKIEAESHAPISILDFQNVSWPEANRAGSTIPIHFSVANNGKGAAKNIHIRAESQNLDALVPKSVSNVNAKYFAPGQTETYSFTFRLSETAEAKNYPIKLSISYADVETGEVHETTQMVTVAVAPSTSGGGKDPSASGGSLGGLSGGDFSGAGLPSQDFGGSSGGFSGDLGPSLPVTGTGDAPQGEAPTGANSPKIIVDSYTLEPQNVTAGATFKLYLHIFNTNRNKSVKNIRASLSADAAEAVSIPDASQEGLPNPASIANSSGGGSAFIPVESSNTLHIEKIKPRHHVEKEIALTTAPDTSPRTYSITVTFEYEDGDGNPYTSSEVIGIPVIQDSVLEPGDLNVDPSGQVGVEMPLSFEFFNTGKSVLSNVMVSLRGDFDADSKTYFIGNVAPSSAETYDINIVPKNKGEQKGEIVITYDDAMGKKQEFVKPFTVDVSDDAALEDAEGQSSEDKPSIPVILGGIAAMAVIAGAIAVYVVKKRKNKDDGDEDLKI